MSEFDFEELGLSKIEQILIKTDVFKDNLEDVEEAKVMIGHLVVLMREQNNLLIKAEEIRKLQEKLVFVLREQVTVLKEMAEVED